MGTRCQVGDRAVIVHAVNPENYGLLVEVLAPHDGTVQAIGKKVFPGGPYWLVHCDIQMVYRDDQTELWTEWGPASDSCLQPIRGLPSESSVEEEVKKTIDVADFLSPVEP